MARRRCAGPQTGSEISERIHRVPSRTHQEATFFTTIRSWGIVRVRPARVRRRPQRRRRNDRHGAGARAHHLCGARADHRAGSRCLPMRPRGRCFPTPRAASSSKTLVAGAPTLARSSRSRSSRWWASALWATLASAAVQLELRHNVTAGLHRGLRPAPASCTVGGPGRDAHPARDRRRRRGAHRVGCRAPPSRRTARPTVTPACPDGSIPAAPAAAEAAPAAEQAEDLGETETPAPARAPAPALVPVATVAATPTCRSRGGPLRRSRRRVYSAPPAPPRPRVPGPGKIGYLAALAWIPDHRGHHAVPEHQRQARGVPRDRRRSDLRGGARPHPGDHGAARPQARLPRLRVRHGAASPWASASASPTNCAISTPTGAHGGAGFTTNSVTASTQSRRPSTPLRPPLTPLMPSGTTRLSGSRASARTRMSPPFPTPLAAT